MNEALGIRFWPLRMGEGHVGALLESSHSRLEKVGAGFSLHPGSHRPRIAPQTD